MTTTPPSINSVAFEALARSCANSVRAMGLAEREARKYEELAQKARTKIETELHTINVLREAIALRHPGAPGRVDGDRWAPPQDYADHGDRYCPVQGDIALPAPTVDMPTALSAVKHFMAADPELAWSWQCNIAMPLFDAFHNISHWQANVGAARLMRHLFGVDIEKNEHFIALAQSEKLDSAVRTDRIAPPAPRTPTQRLGNILSDMREHAEGLTDGEMRDFSDTISAELEHLGGDPVEEVVQGSTEDLRPLIAYPARRVSLAFTHPTIGEGFFSTELLKAMGEFSIYMAKVESFTAREPLPEPRYPFTASNGVVVDVLPWKTVDECGDIPAFPFLSAHDQLTKMTDIIREAADAAKELAGVSGSEQEEPNKPHPFEGKMIRPKGRPDIEPVLFTGRVGEDGAFITVKNLQNGKTGAYVAKDEAFEVAGDAPKVEEVKEWTLASAPPDHRTVVEPSSNRAVPVGNDTPRPEHDAETKSKLIFPAEPSAQPEPVKNLFRVFRDGKPTITLDVYGAAEAVQKLMQPKPEPAPLRPTIGRRVWFFSDERYGQSGLHINDHSQPCDAGIVYVWNDGLVNLDVTDHHGNHHAFSSVTLVQPGEGRPEKQGYWCEWMPFQVGQARAK